MGTNAQTSAVYYEVQQGGAITAPAWLAGWSACEVGQTISSAPPNAIDDLPSNLLHFQLTVHNVDHSTLCNVSFL